MTYKPNNHPDYDKLRAAARSLTDTMLYQRVTDAERAARSVELLEKQGLCPSVSSQQLLDEASFFRSYLKKRVAGLTDDEIQEADEVSDRA
jgi:hypothetical protein